TMLRSLKPLRDLVDVAKAVGKGSLDVRVPEGGRDEVGLLAKELNNMARALEDRQNVLAARSQELMRLTGFAENVIRSVRVGIVVVDDTACVRTLNPAARSVFHLPLVDVDGRPLPDLIDPSLRASVAPILAAIEEVRAK